MTVGEIRQKFLDFYKTHGHVILPGASLVPENDPTTLFTGSGMQPLVPYLLGKEHPMGGRLANSQKCFRAMDIEEVGDNRHTTFFEMLGNWSLGDYFKKEQLSWNWEFFTSIVGLSKDRLWVTCFAGDEKLGLPKDSESFRIWRGLGVPEERIRFYPEKNWWSRAGAPEGMPTGEPGGPDSEVFYEFAEVEHDPKFGSECHPNCDCGRFLEIGNSVFMEYVKLDASTSSGQAAFGKLPKRNVDFGGGLERIAAASIDSPDIFLIDAFEPLIRKLETASGKKYADNPRPFRVLADHTRAAEQLIADGVLPGNVERGYVVRRLIRRAVRYCDVLGLPAGSLAAITDSPEIVKEEERFRETLARGLKEFEKGTDPFVLFTTYGFPFELTKELAAEKGRSIDEADFKKKLDGHQHLSRAGSKQKFKGGLADTSEKTTRLHTAHHLLLKALQTVLGPQVKQRGSNITQERLRIDFNHPEKVTEEQLAKVEKIVNEKIKEDAPVVRTEMNREDAEKLGAEREFGAKYPERVSVYSIGPLDNAFSIEFCGGPHVSRTSKLMSTPGVDMPFKIIKEEAVAQGIRRIKAVLQ